MPANSRMDRKYVLEALHDETGIWGDNLSAPRVRAFCQDPVNASTTEFAYVGSLTLTRFFIDPAMPSGNQKQSLWQSLMLASRFAKPAAALPGGWDGTSTVRQLQNLAEIA